MKKTVRAIVSIILLVTMVFTAVSCGGGLSGTYMAKDGTGSVTFDGDQITMSAGAFDIKGKYRINGDTMTMTFEMAGQSIDQDFQFSQNGNTIILEGQEFTK